MVAYMSLEGPVAMSNYGDLTMINTDPGICLLVMTTKCSLKEVVTVRGI